MTSESPTKKNRRGTYLANPGTTFTVQKSSISSQENTNLMMLNLKEFSGRKGSHNPTANGSDSARIRTQMISDSNRETKPVLLDTS